MRRIASLISGLALALVLSQGPEFAQQYRQRLGGAIDELRLITMTFDAAASRAGLTRQAALARYEATPDAFVSGQGADMRANFTRLDRLQASLAAFERAGPFESLELLGDNYDPAIGRRVLHSFRPAVPATPEGLALAGAGLGIGYGLAAAFLAFGARLARRNRPILSRP